MIIALHISIALNLLALGLIYWLRKEQQTDNGLHEVELHHTHEGLKALISDINNYQVETDRKITELEKHFEIKIKSHDQRMNREKKELPLIIQRVVGHIEFAQTKINRK